MNDAKYIGYVALDMANTMWSSGLCRAGVDFCLSNLPQSGVSDWPHWPHCST
jgi:hypothetical protein